MGCFRKPHGLFARGAFGVSVNEEKNIKAMTTETNHTTDHRPSAFQQQQQPVRTRKVRSDKGKKYGPRKPRKTPSPVPLGIGQVGLPLSGTHGQGHMLVLSAEDVADVLAVSDNGKKLYVITRGGGTTVGVSFRDTTCFVWSKYNGKNPLATLERFLASETHGGRVIRHKDGNPFNLTRENLEIEVKAKKSRHPIDWDKAVSERKHRMGLAKQEAA